jgi:hypothetical protein
MSYIILGVPWVVFGASRLFADSGFLGVYDVLTEIHRQTGNKSLIYLDCLYRDAFDGNNEPEKSGVFPVYSRSERNPTYARTRAVDDAAADKIFDGHAPVDCIISNSNCLIPHLTAQGMSGKYLGIPTVYTVLNAGEDSVINPLGKISGMRFSIFANDPHIYPLYMEACAYLTASHVVWTTQDQKKRGMQIARRFFTHSEVSRLEKRYSIIGHGLGDIIKNYRKTDEEIKYFLKSPKDNFKVSFLGRITRNKNIEYICETVSSLFALYGTQLELNLSANKAVPTVKSSAGEDILNIISDDRFDGVYASREKYASELLPNTQCLMYASFAEGNCVTPREAVYSGVPVLLPRRPWAYASFGENYPFYYNGKNEAFSLIRRIESGNISDDEVQQFLDMRNNGFTCEFMSQTSMKLFSMFKDLIDARRRIYTSRAHSKLDSVLDTIRLGVDFTMEEFGRLLVNNGVSVTNGYSKRAVTLTDVYAFLGDRLECVNPFVGRFRRIR